MRDRSIDLKAGNFAFSACPSPFCNQEGRQDSAYTQPLCPPHFKTTSGYRALIFHRHQIFHLSLHKRNTRTPYSLYLLCVSADASKAGLLVMGSVTWIRELKRQVWIYPACYVPVNNESAVMRNTAFWHVWARPPLLGTVISSNINKCFWQAVKVQSAGESQSVADT